MSYIKLSPTIFKVLDILNPKLQVLLIGFVAFLIICVYGKYRCSHPNYRDPFMTNLGLGNKNGIFGDIDGWSILHFLFFALIGYFYPGEFWVAMGMGVGWELFEHVLGKNRPGFLGGFGDCVTTDPQVSGPWWYGRISDIIVNALGFLIGMSLSSPCKSL